jgi:hypothetical protein
VQTSGVTIRFPDFNLEREQTLEAIVSIDIRFIVLAWSLDVAHNAAQWGRTLDQMVGRKVWEVLDFDFLLQVDALHIFYVGQVLLAVDMS